MMQREIEQAYWDALSNDNHALAALLSRVLDELFDHDAVLHWPFLSRCYDSAQSERPTPLKDCS